MAITNKLKISQATGQFNDFGWADITVENGNTTVTTAFPQLQLPIRAEASVLTSAGLQKSGFIVTVSGYEVTVANNGSTTAFASADTLLVKAFSHNGI